GAHRIALAAHVGPVLPGSQAPGAAHLRDVVRTQLRESLLAEAGVDTLLAYARTADGLDDVAVWLGCLQLLPPRSPRRAAVVARLDALDAHLTTAAGGRLGAGQPRRLRG